MIRRYFKSPTNLLGTVLLILFVIIAILAPVICPPKAGADAFKIPIAIAPAKTNGAVSRPENAPPPRISLKPLYLIKAV